MVEGLVKHYATLIGLSHPKQQLTFLRVHHGMNFTTMTPLRCYKSIIAGSRRGKHKKGFMNTYFPQFMKPFISSHRYHINGEKD